MTLPIIISRSPNALLYDVALASAYQIGSTWIPDPDYALSKDPEFYEKASRDPVLRHAIEQRLHMVAGRDPQVVQRSKRPAEVLKAKIHEELLQEITMYCQSSYQLAKAVFQGAAYGLVEGERRWCSIAGLPPEDWWVPTRIRDVNWRRIRYATGMEDDGAGTGAKRRSVWAEIFSVDSRTWGRIADPGRMIRFVYDDQEAGLNYGLGLAAALYTYYWLKEKALTEGMAGLERWARGLVTVGVDATGPGAVTLDNAKLRNNWLKVINAMASRHQIVHDKRDEVNVHTGGGEGHAMCMDFIRYLDDSMVQLLLGAVLPTGGGGDTGSNSRSQTEAESTETLVGYDRRLLYEVFQRDLGGLIEANNGPQFWAVGCGDARKPFYRPSPVEQHDPEQGREALDCAKRNAMPVCKDEAYELLGLRKPIDGQDETFDNVAPEPAAFPGMGGGFGGGEFGRRRIFSR